MKKILYYSLAAMLLAAIAILESCSTSSVMVKVLVPAEITVPVNIQKVAVANRSLPGKGEKLNNVIEGVLSGEGLFEDREGSERCVAAVYDELQSSPRYKVIFPSGLDLRGTGTSEFPIPLEWQEVEKICKANDADALITLETFDSNSSIRYTAEERTKKVEGKDVKYTVQVAFMDVAISAGWRIYDAANKKIVDQNVFIDHKGWTGEGNTRENAFNRLPDKRSMIKDAGYFAGHMYGIRISPNWVNVSRMYYIKVKGTGAEDFILAKEKVKISQWKEAAGIWQKYTTAADKKIAGRATYNMAAACEIEGNLEAALEWAKKSYDYGNGSARSYINEINKRIMDQEKLREQMK